MKLLDVVLQEEETATVGIAWKKLLLSVTVYVFLLGKLVVGKTLI